MLVCFPGKISKVRFHFVTDWTKGYSLTFVDQRPYGRVCFKIIKQKNSRHLREQHQGNDICTPQNRNAAFCVAQSCNRREAELWKRSGIDGEEEDDTGMSDSFEGRSIPATDPLTHTWARHICRILVRCLYGESWQGLRPCSEVHSTGVLSTIFFK